MGVRRGGSRAPKNGASLIAVQRGTLGGLPNVQAVLEALYSGGAGLLPKLVRANSETTISVNDGPNQLVLGDPSGGTFLLHLPLAPSDGFQLTVKNIAGANFVDIRAGTGEFIQGNGPSGAWGVSPNDSYVFVYDAASITWWVLAEYDAP